MAKNQEGSREAQLRAQREAAYAARSRSSRPVDVAPPRVIEPALPHAPSKAFQKIKAGLGEALAVAKGEAKPARVTMIAVAKRGPKKGSGGRPRLEEADKTLKATKPWVAAGMSQRTWYRRQREKAETKS